MDILRFKRDQYEAKNNNTKIRVAMPENLIVSL